MLLTFLTLSTSWLPTSAAPAVGPYPEMMLSTPAGSPADRHGRIQHFIHHTNCSDVARCTVASRPAAGQWLRMRFTTLRQGCNAHGHMKMHCTHLSYPRSCWWATVWGMPHYVVLESRAMQHVTVHSRCGVAHAVTRAAAPQHAPASSASSPSFIAVRGVCSAVFSMHITSADMHCTELSHP
jgi:hypothetical protein